MHIKMVYVNVYIKCIEIDICYLLNEKKKNEKRGRRGRGGWRGSRFRGSDRDLCIPQFPPTLIILFHRFSCYSSADNKNQKENHKPPLPCPKTPLLSPPSSSSSLSFLPFFFLQNFFRKL